LGIADTKVLGCWMLDAGCGYWLGIERQILKDQLAAAVCKV
jgi:hypothetical protein